MPYWQIVTRSFRIAWDRKYLWLLAFFSGEASYSFNYSQGTTRPTNQPPNVGAIRDQVTTWISDHIGLIIALAVVWLVLAVAIFILAAVCEGATIRASAEHDAERPFGLGLAWSMGVHTMWVVARFRLLILALNLPLLILVAGWLFALLAALANQSAVAIAPLILTGLPLLAVWFVYGTYLFFLDRLGSRAVILEQLKALPAIGRAHRLLVKRLGRTLLVWLLSIGVALVIGIVLACVGAVVVAPFVTLAALAGSGSSTVGVILAAVLAIIFVPVFVVVYGFVGAVMSTYWTLAFRRLDLDYAPAYAYPVAPQPPPTPPAPPGTQV
ncbi:MAG TPA: hypothetical protein VGX22_10665 [Candidatus Dormibacteraeota bacterium]|nr:hypothetical protein [Candidatus Dormibacteraeota bacterium]